MMAQRSRPAYRDSHRLQCNGSAMAMNLPWAADVRNASNDANRARAGPRIAQALPGQAEGQGVELRTAQHQ